MITPQQNFEQSVAAVLYPDRIIIETRNKKGYSTWYSTDNLTILPLDISDAELGNIIMNHISQSKEEIVSIDQIKKIRENYRKKAKFKSEKATMQNAKYVSLYSNGDTIRFEPKKNKIAKGAFYGMPDKIFEVKINSDYASIGSNIRKAWDACTFD